MWFQLAVMSALSSPGAPAHSILANDVSLQEVSSRGLGERLKYSADSAAISSYQHRLELADLATLFRALASDDIHESVAAHITLTKRGRPILPRLVQEMNREVYLTRRKFFYSSDKLRNPAWQNRMRIAAVIQDVSGQDFLVNTTASGWDADISFKQINAWWQNSLPAP